MIRSKWLTCLQVVCSLFAGRLQAAGHACAARQYAQALASLLASQPRNQLANSGNLQQVDDMFAGLSAAVLIGSCTRMCCKSVCTSTSLCPASERLPASHALCLPGALILSRWMSCLQTVGSCPLRQQHTCLYCRTICTSTSSPACQLAIQSACQEQ